MDGFSEASLPWKMAVTLGAKYSSPSSSVIVSNSFRPSNTSERAERRPRVANMLTASSTEVFPTLFFPASRVTRPSSGMERFLIPRNPLIVRAGRCNRADRRVLDILSTPCKDLTDNRYRRTASFSPHQMAWSTSYNPPPSTPAWRRTPGTCRRGARRASRSRWRPPPAPSPPPSSRPPPPDDAASKSRPAPSPFSGRRRALGPSPRAARDSPRRGSRG